MNKRVFTALRKLANIGQPKPTRQQPKQQVTPATGSLPATSVASSTSPIGNTTPAQKVYPRPPREVVSALADPYRGSTPPVQEPDLGLLGDGEFPVSPDIVQHFRRIREFNKRYRGSTPNHIRR